MRTIQVRRVFFVEMTTCSPTAGNQCTWSVLSGHKLVPHDARMFNAIPAPHAHPRDIDL